MLVYDRVNSSVFNDFLNSTKDAEERTASGKLFQAEVASAEKPVYRQWWLVTAVMIPETVLLRVLVSVSVRPSVCSAITAQQQRHIRSWRKIHTWGKTGAWLVCVLRGYCSGKTQHTASVLFDPSDPVPILLLNKSYTVCAN